MTNDYLVTVKGTYHWFPTERDVEDFVNIIKEEHLYDTEITYIVQAENIPVDSIRSFTPDPSKALENQIQKVRNELCKIPIKEYVNMPDSVKNFLKSINNIVNPKPTPPENTVIKG